VENGTTLLETPGYAYRSFGAHNLNNLAGAKWICQNMGVDEDDFYEAIASFKGASKRLEKIAESRTKVVQRFCPFTKCSCHHTSGKKRTDRILVACLELHTYSSLNSEFLKEYEGALEYADVAVVFIPQMR
jgi:UDP-N-acetylmuramate: L-alanyl-gamma-D-glutamyl-meso-diaminopimelate ligase